MLLKINVLSIVVWQKPPCFPNSPFFFSCPFPLFCPFHLQILIQILSSVQRKQPFIAGIYLKLNTTKAFSGNIPLTMQEKCQAALKNTIHYTLRERRAEGQTLSAFFFFFLYPSHIYFIRCILHRFHSGRIALRPDTHSRTQTYTHATGPQMSTGACSNSVFFFFFPLSEFLFFLIHPRRITNTSSHT